MRKIMAGGLIFLCVVFNFSLSTWATSSANSQLKIEIYDFIPSWLNALDSHEWLDPKYNVEISSVISYKEFSGRRAMQVKYRRSAGTNSWSVIRVDEFIQPEIWSMVTAVRVDVYIASTSADAKGMKLELKTKEDVFIQGPYQANLPKNTWYTVEWPLQSIAVWVSQVMLVPDGITDGDIFYFNNLRLVRGGVEEPWDTFQASTYRWVGSMDFNPWKADWGRNEPITHNQRYNNSAGVLVIPWAASKTSYSWAKMEATNLRGIDFSSFKRFRVQAKSTAPGINIKMDFFDGATVYSTNELSFSKADTWESLTWDKPYNLNLANLRTFMFMVNTSGGGSGEVLIDQIEFLKN
jgi:hypothetical protein